MAKRSNVKGVDKALKNLSKKIGELKDSSVEGLEEGSEKIMENASGITPYDTGNLRNSRFIVSSAGKITMGNSPIFRDAPGRDSVKMTAKHSEVVTYTLAKAQEQTKPTVIFGYTAHYASITHEGISHGTVMTFKPPGESHYFEKAINQSEDDVMRALQQVLRRKIK